MRIIISIIIIFLVMFGTSALLDLNWINAAKIRIILVWILILLEAFIGFKLVIYLLRIEDFKNKKEKL